MRLRSLRAPLPDLPRRWQMIWSLLQNPLFVLAAPGAVAVFLSVYASFKGEPQGVELTLTTSHKPRVGERVALDGDTGEPLWVISTSGAGPYSSVLRATPTWRIRLRLSWRRLRSALALRRKERP